MRDRRGPEAIRLSRPLNQRPEQAMVPQGSAMAVDCGLCHRSAGLADLPGRERSKQLATSAARHRCRRIRMRALRTELQWSGNFLGRPRLRGARLRCVEHRPPDRHGRRHRDPETVPGPNGPSARRTIRHRHNGIRVRFHRCLRLPLSARTAALTSRYRAPHRQKRGARLCATAAARSPARQRGERARSTFHYRYRRRIDRLPTVEPASRSVHRPG